MLQLIKSPQAEIDLIDIWLYVADDQPVNADRLLDRLNNAVLKLVDTPGMGVDRPDVGCDVKGFPVGNYVVYYRVKQDQFELVRVLSASRDIDQLHWW